MDLDEITLYNWQKCLKGETKYINRKEKATKWDEIIWERVYNTYLDRFGIGEAMEEYLNCMQLVTKLRCQFILTGNDFLLNQIAIEEINLENLDPTKIKGLDLDEMLIELGKFMGGTMLDKRQITIVQYENLKKRYARSNKKE